MVSQTVSYCRIKKKHGGGKMGVVCLTENTRLDRQVVIKSLSADYLGDQIVERRNPPFATSGTWVIRNVS